MSDYEDNFPLVDREFFTTLCRQHGMQIHVYFHDGYSLDAHNRIIRSLNELCESADDGLHRFLRVKDLQRAEAGFDFFFPDEDSKKGFDAEVTDHDPAKELLPSIRITNLQRSVLASGGPVMGKMPQTGSPTRIIRFQGWNDCPVSMMFQLYQILKYPGFALRTGEVELVSSVGFPTEDHSIWGDNSMWT